MKTDTTQQTISLALTEAQRRLTAELQPGLANRLRLDECNQRSVKLSEAEVGSIQLAAENALPTTDSGARRNSLRHIIHKSKITRSRSRFNGGVLVQHTNTRIAVDPNSVHATDTVTTTEPLAALPRDGRYELVHLPRAGGVLTVALIPASRLEDPATV